MDSQDADKRRFLQHNVGIGIVFLIVGAVLVLRQTGYPLPSWLFTWPMILIVVGLLVGLKHGFRDFSWLMMILVGGLFLSDEIFPNAHLTQYLVPGIVILLGIVFIFAPKNKRFSHARRRHERMRRRFRQYHEHFGDEPQFPGNPGVPDTGSRLADTDSLESSIDILSVFSGIKKKVISKNFRGGEVTCIFGGAELNLINSDFVSPIRLEFVQILGGAKLIVPANWEVRSEVTAIFGGIEDKRPPSTAAMPERTIILDGTVFLGGIEVNSF